MHNSHLSQNKFALSKLQKRKSETGKYITQQPPKRTYREFVVLLEHQNKLETNKRTFTHRRLGLLSPLQTRKDIMLPQALKKRNQEIYEAWLTKKYTAMELAIKFNMTPARVYQIVQELQQEQEPTLSLDK